MSKITRVSRLDLIAAGPLGLNEDGSFNLNHIPLNLNGKEKINYQIDIQYMPAKKGYDFKIYKVEESIDKD
jgi:hypothetical protein